LDTGPGFSRHAQQGLVPRFVAPIRNCFHGMAFRCCAGVTTCGEVNLSSPRPKSRRLCVTKCSTPPAIASSRTWSSAGSDRLGRHVLPGKTPVQHLGTGPLRTAQGCDKDIGVLHDFHEPTLVSQVMSVKPVAGAGSGLFCRVAPCQRRNRSRPVEPNPVINTQTAPAFEPQAPLRFRFRWRYRSRYRYRHVRQGQPTGFLDTPHPVGPPCCQWGSGSESG
jgi:hypothetical protein